MRVNETRHPETSRILSLIETQRETALADLVDLSEASLWRRPGPEQWSIGEQIDHCRTLWRMARWLLSAWWPAAALAAWPIRRRPATAAIDNVYLRPSMPLSVGWLFPPRYGPGRHAPLKRLATLLKQEHRHAAAFYLSHNEALLAHAPLYDPAIGRLNYLQALRVGAYHDAHHFDAIRRLAEQLRTAPGRSKENQA